MYEDAIKKMLTLVPDSVIGSTRFVRHFVYGASSKLKKTRSKIKDVWENASFYFNDGGMVITVNSKITLASLLTASGQIENITKEAGLEYDGCEISLEDEEMVSEKAMYDSFGDHFAPASYARLMLGNGKFGYVLYLGGDNKSGHFFDCIKFVDNGKATPLDLDKAPRLYRSFIQGVFDPSRCENVGASLINQLPRTASFRYLEGHPSPEEVERIYIRYGFSSPCDDKDWLDLLGKVVASGGADFYSPSSFKCSVSLTSSGKVKWSEMLKMEGTECPYPMPFGVIARFEKLNEVLTGGVDEIGLLDQVSRQR